jgi:uncharacterized protein YkwD
VLVAGVVALVVHAAHRSFVPYLTELIAFGVGLGLAFAAFPAMGQFVHAHTSVALGVAGFGSFLAVLVVAHAIVQPPVHRLAQWLGAGVMTLPDSVREVVSAMPGLGVAALGAALLLATMLAVPVQGMRSAVTGSLLASQIVDRTGFVNARVQQLLVPTDPSSRPPLLNDPVSNPGEDAFLKLQFPPDLTIQPDPVAEDRMLSQINAARAQNGLSPLRSDPLLQQAARAHSADMYQRHYFSHQTPDGKTPYDRLHDLRFHYVTAGENLAFAPDVDQAWTSLMQSPDHRANILNPDFRCVGIGAYKGLNGYEEMFTQDFADCPS